MTLAFYLLLYFIGLAAGLAANVAFDLQLRRPGARQSLGVLLFVVLLFGVTAVTRTPLQAVLLPVLWAGTGVLAGFGSRGTKAPG